MLNINSHRKPVDRFSRPRRTADEQDVQSGLSYTPQEMLKMAQNGEPITPLNLNQVEVEEGYSNLNFDTPLQYQRGIDIGDCWEAEMSSKKALKRAKDNIIANPQNFVES